MDCGVALETRQTDSDAVLPNWRDGLPKLAAPGLLIRELETSDAAPLRELLTNARVSQFLAAAPDSVGGFERFIARTHQERAAGNYFCFGVVPEGQSTAVGIFQMWRLEPGFSTAEWGFALGHPYWGRGLFVGGASLVLDFAFNRVGVHRLEARVSVDNHRGAAAIRKLGAVREGVLRKCFRSGDEYVDYVMWALLDEEWRARRPQV